jgi:thiamine biosynthesis lipoprotein
MRWQPGSKFCCREKTFVSLRAAGEEALDEIERLEAQLSLFKPASEISRLNSRAAREPVRVTPAVFGLLQHAQG